MKKNKDQSKKFDMSSNESMYDSLISMDDFDRFIFGQMSGDEAETFAELIESEYELDKLKASERDVEFEVDESMIDQFLDDTINKLNAEELIEDYVLNRLSSEEESVVEERMKQDLDFKQEVFFQTVLFDAVREEGSEIKGTKAPPESGNIGASSSLYAKATNSFRNSIRMLLVIAASFLVLFFYKKIPNSDLSSQTNQHLIEKYKFPYRDLMLFQNLSIHFDKTEPLYWENPFIYDSNSSLHKMEHPLNKKDSIQYLNYNVEKKDNINFKEYR